MDPPHGTNKMFTTNELLGKFWPPTQKGHGRFFDYKRGRADSFYHFFGPSQKQKNCISKFAYANFATQDRCILIQHVLIELICIAHVVIEHVFIDDVLRLLLESVLSSTYT